MISYSQISDPTLKSYSHFFHSVAADTKVYLSICLLWPAITVDWFPPLDSVLSLSLSLFFFDIISSDWTLIYKSLWASSNSGIFFLLSHFSLHRLDLQLDYVHVYRLNASRITLDDQIDLFPWWMQQRAIGSWIHVQDWLFIWEKLLILILGLVTNLR